MDLGAVVLSCTVSLATGAIIGAVYVDKKIDAVEYRIDQLQNDCRRIAAIEDGIYEKIGGIRYRIDILGTKVVGRRRWQKRTAGE